MNAMSFEDHIRSGGSLSEWSGLQCEISCLENDKNCPHPDADLLALCARLAEMQEEWQRLWDACPEDGCDCLENEAHEAYAADVWPGQGDPLLKLSDLHATTPEGCQHKAAAVLAAYEASSYTNVVHDDICSLMANALRDAAGPARMQTGDLR